MGEVYSAEDLRLGQTVALKFLPERIAGDTGALARFHQEVRLARQISHPNVCRVFDIDESKGRRPFLSMEYVDGEDLASLLRRIGRLPVDKAAEVAQQLCAGLAAIHASGVVHRDLKPSNIMLDGRGRARIMDFGVSTDVLGAERLPVIGTPAYMAPEQLAKGVVTAQSDLYSLGLILYQVFTGQRTLAGETPQPPSALVRDLDPRVDRALLQCLDLDPAARPASALALASLLPGLDPLAAAVAADETPSPEMVAAAPKQGSLRPAVGLSCLAGVILACAGIVALAPHVLLHRRVALDYSTDVLADRARNVLRASGVNISPGYVCYGLMENKQYARHLRSLPGNRLEEARVLEAARRSPLLLFWYRQSSRPLVPRGLEVTASDPPRTTPGEAYVELDSQGHLYRLEIIPSARNVADKPGAMEWAPLFETAGLDFPRFTPEVPVSIPPVYVDSRAAWSGSLTSAPYPPVLTRIEAGTLHGYPLYFRAVEPWQDEPANAHLRMEVILNRGFYVTVALAALMLAWRNLQLGRGDTKWAFKLSCLVVTASLTSTLLSAAQMPVDLDFWRTGIGDAFRRAAMIGLCYLSLEPLLRRRWPGQIISWSRLLAGSFRDPLVGRDFLIGSLLGSGMTLLLFSHSAVVMWWTGSLDSRILVKLQRFGSVSGFLRILLYDLTTALMMPLSFLVFLLIARVVLRRNALALFVTWIVPTTVLVLRFPRCAAGIPLVGLACALFVLSWARFGLLAGSVQYFTLTLSFDYGMDMNLSAWHAWVGAFALMTILALSVYGFLISAAGPSWFSKGLMKYERSP